MSPKVVGVIPARLNSKRFYGKVLFKYRGKPLIQYLYEELLKSKVMDSVIIATDNLEVKRAVELFGAKVVMTPSNVRTGSDRTAYAAKSVKADIYVNVQGDALGISHSKLDRAIKEFSADQRAEYGTIAREIEDDKELLSSDAVKVVLTNEDHAAWFSRQPIPHVRNPRSGQLSNQSKFYYHIGVYMYRRPALLRFASWNSTPCERAESLEQLRILENGKKIKVFVTDMKTVSVDSPKDVLKLKKVYN
jgi:3-deoxy-manno-octulosonate cytidylyltransferase (CMP-KDO synthetase)